MKGQGASSHISTDLAWPTATPSFFTHDTQKTLQNWIQMHFT